MALYALTIFSSAFLLFQVQPIVAKYILPWYGGSQAVWSVSLLFFQAFLLIGYLYAHLLRRVRSEKTQVLVHVSLLAASLFFLPIVPGESWRLAGGGAEPTWQILGLLTATLGLPYMLLASTSPLVQSWSSVHRSKSPYRLYALSNLGSLLGLLTYPFLVEPALPRSAQAAAWSWGMGGFALLAAVAAVRSLRGAVPPRAGEETGRAADAHPPGTSTVTLHGMNALWPYLFWVLLPALASVLLLSTTNKLVQELVAIPFLWILPLALYLVSFILTFDSSRWYDRRAFVAILAVAFGGVLWFLMMKEDPPLLLSIAFYLAALFAGCMVCHGELVRLKPPPARLTAFYLSLSAGGALGGVFVALIAPVVFNDYLEYPLVLVLVPAAWLAVWLLRPAAGDARPVPRRHAAAAFTGIVAFAAAMAMGRPGGENVIAKERNFYGTLTIAEYERPGSRGHHRTMRHGRILHGLQYLHPNLEKLPTAYFTGKSGVGLTLANFPRRKGAGLKIGVIGLGVGTLAAWTSPGDTIRYYEINPAVDLLARKYFTYLGSSAGREDVVIGDGRLTLGRERPQGYDVLVLDAFNNDSPPLHLLTRESFEMYFRHLKPDGAIAVNITSKYINFVPVMSAVAGYFGYPWTTVIDFNREDEYLRTVSFWVVMTRNGGLLSNEALAAASNQPVIIDRVPLWTDDFTSLFDIVEW